jgi:WD40 repeat protein
MGNGSSKSKPNQYLAQVCDEHEGSINCMELSADDSVLATGSDDGHVRLWTTKTDVVECIGVLEGHADYITSVLIVENFLLSASADKTIRKWDMSTCECILDFVGHDSTVNKIIYTGEYLFSVSYDKTARLWDFETGDCIKVFSGHTNNVTSLVHLKNKGAFGNKKKSDDSSKKRREDELSPTVTQDILITGSLDCTARAWSVQSGSCLNIYKAHTSAITCICLDKLENTLFTASADCTIKSWEIGSGDLLTIFKGHESPVLCIKVNNYRIIFNIS